jgi:hypothetical protein
MTVYIIDSRQDILCRGSANQKGPLPAQLILNADLTQIKSNSLIGIRTHDLSVRAG